MLGKGLESLIPPKGGQGSGGTGVPQQPFVAPIPVDPAVSPALAPAPAAPSAPAPAPVIMPTVPEARLPEPEIAKKEITAPQASAPRQMESIFHIEIEKIKPNPDQPRRNFDEAALRDLAQSIREFGFLQPIVVSKIEKETPDGVAVEYQLIAGERRFLAAKLLGLPVVPAIIRNVNLEREKLELAVIENLQRENLNPIEAARAFQRLQEEFRMTQREIASKLSKSREVVANAVRLLDLPEYAQKAVEEGKLSESNARFLLAIEEPGTQKRLFDEIVQNSLTTRDVRERVHAMGVATGSRRGRPPKGSGRPLPPEVKAMQESLSSDLGAPVEIHQGANTGHITITFYSEEELESILRKLKQEL